MEIEKKKKTSPVVIIIIILFIVFMSLYITGLTDLYQYGEYSKSNITEKSIKQFEKDVSEGKNIVIENYLENTKKDYTNGISKLGAKTSKAVEEFMTKGIKETFKVLSVLFKG